MDMQGDAAALDMNRKYSYHAIALLQEGRVADAIQLLSHVLSSLSDIFGTSSAEESLNAAHYPKYEGCTYMMTNYIASVHLIPSHVQEELQLQQLYQLQHNQESTSDSLMDDFLSCGYFNKAFCTAKLTNQVAISPWVCTTSEEVTLTITALYNTALAFQRMGQETGKSRFLFKALSVYEQICLTAQRLPESHHRTLSLLLMAVCLNKSYIYAELLFDEAKAIEARVSLEGLIEKHGYQMMNQDEVCLFVTERSRFKMSRAVVAAAA
jgi:hypothetical protein